MWRLSPPTKTTFFIGMLAIVAGVLIQLGLVTLAEIEDLEDPAFWITAAGGGVLTIGVLFKRI